MLRWYYFFTADYGFWHKHLQERLGPYFDLYPIQIDELKINERKGHHFRGVATKIDLVREAIAANAGKGIVFSDCTLYVSRQRVSQLQSYLNDCCNSFDILFCDNVVNRQVNIGLMLLDCNRRTRAFWDAVSRDFRPESWDQRLVNRRLGTIGALRWFRRPGITWARFDRSRMVCGHVLPQEFRETFFTFKQFIHPGTREHNWNERFRLLHEAGLLSAGEYAENVLPTRSSRTTRESR